MALGALLKVKMDSTAVARGLRRIRSGFGALGGAISRVRGAWGKLKGSAIGAAFGAIAQQVQNTAKWMLKLRNETEALGESTKEVLTIREALEMSGVDPGQAGGMMNEMKRRLAESMESRDSEPGRALKLLGLNPKELFQMGGGQAFRTIMNAVRVSEKNENQLIRALDQLFGGAGMEAFGLAKDFADRMQLAAEAVDDLATAFDKKGVDGIRKMQVRMSQFRNSMRLFFMEFVENLPLGAVANLMKTIAKQAPKIIQSMTAFFTDPMGEGSWLRAIADWFEAIFTKLLQGLKNWGLDMKNDFMEMLRTIPIFGKKVSGVGFWGEGENRQSLIPDLRGPKFSPNREGRVPKEMLEQQKKSNDHLRDIARRRAIYA